jgi:Uma2 family endonuclease
VFEAGLKKERHTYADYARTPEGAGYQLLEGDIVMAPAPHAGHQRIAARIVHALLNHVVGGGLGEVYFAPFDVYLDDENVVQPDILFISKERLPIVEEKYIKGPPDLVVEILSESSSRRDLIQKRELYARFGVREYWIVSPGEECIDVFILAGADYRLERAFKKPEFLESPGLPGLKLDLATVFS